MLVYRDNIQACTSTLHVSRDEEYTYACMLCFGYFGLQDHTVQVAKGVNLLYASPSQSETPCRRDCQFLEPFCMKHDAIYESHEVVL